MAGISILNQINCLRFKYSHVLKDFFCLVLFLNKITSFWFLRRTFSKIWTRIWVFFQYSNVEYYVEYNTFELNIEKKSEAKEIKYSTFCILCISINNSKYITSYFFCIKMVYNNVIKLLYNAKAHRKFTKGYLVFKNWIDNILYIYVQHFFVQLWTDILHIIGYESSLLHTNV